MIVNTDARLDEIKNHLIRFNSIVPWSIWKKRFEEFDFWLNQNPLSQEFIEERFKIEHAYRNIKQYLSTHQKYPWPIRSENEYRFLSFMMVMNQVYENLSQKGKDRVAGIMRGCLKDDYGVSSFAFEIKVSAHLMKMGFDVEFHDIEDRGFDFLARQNGREIEIECKHISADAGRKVHRKDLYSLGGYLSPLMEALLHESNGGTYIKIIVPSRLTSSPQQQKSIKQSIENALAQRQNISVPECSIEVSSFELDASLFRTGKISRSAASKYIEDKFGSLNKHCLFMYRVGKLVCVSVESRQSDKVVTNIFQHLREESKRQFTRERPGMLFVHLADLTPAQMIKIAEAQSRGTDIQRAISILLSKRHHLHTVALMCDGDVRHSTAGELQSIQESGPTYTFHNKFNPYYEDPVMQSVLMSGLSS